MKNERLWRGGGAGRRAVAIGFLLAPATLVMTIAGIALTVGASLEFDQGVIVLFTLRTSVAVSYILCGVYGLPVFYGLARCGRAGLVPLILAGTLPGLAFWTMVAVRTSGLSAFIVMAAGAAAACGALVAAVFWLVVRSLERR